MRTFIYMVRHGDSPKKGEIDRDRGLTETGREDAKRITKLLKEEEIDVFVSSPYARAVLTIQELADTSGKEVLLYDDLKERKFAAGDMRISDEELNPLLEQSFSDFKYKLPGGESNLECQNRAVKALKDLLLKYEGEKIAIGTHGAVMILMMGYFDSKYNLEFLHQLSKPDVYKLSFEGEELVEAKRLWGNEMI